MPTSVDSVATFLRNLIEGIIHMPFLMSYTYFLTFHHVIWPAVFNVLNMFQAYFLSIDQRNKYLK